MEESEMKFKDMTPKKKAEHIWEYYKLHIFSVIIIIIVVVSFLTKEPAKELYCGVGIYGPHITNEEITLLTDSLNSAVQAGETESVQVTNFYLTEDDELQDVDMVNKFNTYVMALQLHLIIGIDKGFNEFLIAEYVAPLTDYLPEDTINRLDEKGLIYYGTIGEETEEKPYGIKITDSQLFKSNNILQDEDIYMGFVPILDNDEKTLKVTDCIINSLLDE